MTVTIRASGAYDLPAETFILLMIEPALSGPTHQVLEERLQTTPTTFSQLSTDASGNPQRRLVAPAGAFTFDFTASVEVQPDVPIPDEAEELSLKYLPVDLLVYTLPSRYCQSDLLAFMARDEFGKLAPGGKRVNAIAAWIRQHVTYRYGTTDAHTSAYDTATQRVGVCRDFGHLLIAFCRALGIPARYVSGYALGLETPDFHGYAQVYLGDRWYNVDPTTEAMRPVLVPITVGRDAADAAMMTLWGAGTIREQFVQVREAPPMNPRNAESSSISILADRDA